MKWLGVTLAGVLGTSTLWIASEWWETGLATQSGDPLFSADGCYRVETLTPFWVLPGIFHRGLIPPENMHPTWFPAWQSPGFYRLYDQRTGELLGQSQIYDLGFVGGPLNWGSRKYPQVTAGQIVIGPTSADCPNDQPAQPLLQPPQVCVERL